MERQMLQVEFPMLTCADYITLYFKINMHPFPPGNFIFLRNNEWAFFE